ncbi:MAG: dienelactone hydrolase family protein, partial [Proteobacteria bacterium]|nr:dienelactone hydrolase family protein [Pseudomonadota bacterium]
MIKRYLLLACLLCLSVQAQNVPHSPTADDELPAAITGNAPPLAGSDVAYFPDDPNAVGYLALPTGGGNNGKYGAVILIHEWNGLAPRIRETADALAAEGYVALAVDLYSGFVGTSREENISLMQEVNQDPETMIANLNAAVNYLKSRSDVEGKVVAMGWCFGGGVALSYALGSDHHDGTAIFYGRLVDDPQRLKHIHHEVYGTFAKNDRGIPVESVNSFVDAMRSAGIKNDV